MLLQTRNLTKDYGRFRALDDVSLSVAEGEVFGLLGPNGSGKTTALRMLLGFLRPSAGSASIAGHDCWRDSVSVRQKVAYLPGELRLYENMTGRQLVAFLLKLRGQTVTARVDELARRFDIDLTRPIAHLSSGMKRKVALLTVLAPRIPLVILDEPTNALDPTMRDELLAQLRRVRLEGQTVVFSSHVLGEVEAVCDRVAILRRGQLVHLQKLDELGSRRLIKVRLRQPVEPPTLDGLSVREATTERLTLEMSAPLTPLLEWLSRQPVADLDVQPLGLNALYHRYHGAVE
jgi:ABC-2 type transport system ATP-binding protein